MRWQTVILVIMVSAALPLRASDLSGQTPDPCMLIPRAGAPIKGQLGVDRYLASSLPPDALEGAVISKCALHVSFANRDIRGMEFDGVAGAAADFTGAQAEKAMFVQSDLTRARFRSAHLSEAIFRDPGESLKGADFTGAVFGGDMIDRKVLGGATFQSVDMDSADLAGSFLNGMVFEPDPHKLPDVHHLGEAIGLETVRSPVDDTALKGLRKQFGELEMEQQVRDLTLDIRRSEQQLSWHQCFTGNAYDSVQFKNHAYSRRLGACVLFVSRAIGLDATNQFGLRPWRPLLIVAVLALIWAGVLTVWLPVAPRRSVAMVFKTTGGEDKTILLHQLVRAYRVRKRPLGYAKIATALTLASVFNLPFKDFEVGRWLRMTTHRDYEFRTRGRIRTFTGWLSLLCSYLFALWVLNFFVHPLSN